MWIYKEVFFHIMITDVFVKNSILSKATRISEDIKILKVRLVVFDFGLIYFKVI